MMEAPRCAALASHSAAGIVVTQLPLLPQYKLQLKESERLLRSAEALARLATSLFQSLTTSSQKTAKPSNTGDVVMGDGNTGTTQTGRARKRRSRKRKKQAKAETNVEEVLAIADVVVEEPAPSGVRPSKRTLRSRTSASRTPPRASRLPPIGIGANVAIVYPPRVPGNDLWQVGVVQSIDASGHYTVLIDSGPIPGVERELLLKLCLPCKSSASVPR